MIVVVDIVVDIVVVKSFVQYDESISDCVLSVTVTVHHVYLPIL